MTTIELSTTMRGELERIARDGPPNLARRARIVLARADGASLTVIAGMVSLHRDSVRRWVIRFRNRGLSGLRHGNAGRPKNVVFGESVREEIRRRAGMDPRALGEQFDSWSLYKLRDHLIRKGVVRSISVESLRLLLRAGQYSREHWGQPASSIGPLAPEVREQLAQLLDHPSREQAQRARAVLAVVDGATISHVANSLHMGKNSLRRWLQHFRLSGVSGLSGPGVTPKPRQSSASMPSSQDSLPSADASTQSHRTRS